MNQTYTGRMVPDRPPTGHQPGILLVVDWFGSHQSGWSICTRFPPKSDTNRVPYWWLVVDLFYNTIGARLITHSYRLMTGVDLFYNTIGARLITYSYRSMTGADQFYNIIGVWLITYLWHYCIRLITCYLIYIVWWLLWTIFKFHYTHI